MAAPNPDTLARLRTELKPKGTAHMVGLHLKDASYFDADFVQGCVAELATRCALIGAHMDLPLTHLERLAIHVLLDSAHIDQKDL